MRRSRRGFLSSLPVGGEQDDDLAQWRRVIEMRAVDTVPPDVCWVATSAP
jgi:L-alanine-DL-glutamate epimerase-like enolase superfamily enzyme